MIALPNYRPHRSLLPLVRTLFDITLLRKGPDSIPASGILLLLVIGLLFALDTFVFDAGQIWFAKHMIEQGLIDSPPLFQICLRRK